MKIVNRLQSVFRRPAAAKRAGVTAHRLFPAFCAVWLGALFALGTLVARADALAGLARHLHLPGATPQPGMFARLILVVLLGGLGTGIGLLLGRVLHGRASQGKPQSSVATPPLAKKPGKTAAPETAATVARADSTEPHRSQRVRSRDAHPDAPPRRPLIVTEDVLPYPTMMGEGAPSVSPAPSTAPAPSPSPAPSSSPALQTDVMPDIAIAPMSDTEELPPFLAAAFAAVRKDDTPPFLVSAEPVIAPAEPVPPIDTMPEPEPAAIRTHDFIAAKPAATEPDMVAPTADVPHAAPASPAPLTSVAAAAPQPALGDMPLASLGLVHLIERLAVAIATRQQHQAHAIAAHDAGPALYDPPSAGEGVDPFTPLHRFDPVTMDPAGPLLRTKPSRGNATEHAADPADAPHPHADDVAAHDHQEIPADAHVEVQAEGRYSSLADMVMPRPELVAYVPMAEHALELGHEHYADAHDDTIHHDDPVVQFPSRLVASDGAAQPLAPTEADRALREALATLRQMSAQR